MKYILIFILTIFSNTIFSQEKITEVIYKKKSTLNLNEKQNKFSQAAPQSNYLVKSAYEKMQSIEYKLFFNNKESYFEMVKSLDTDNQKGNVSKLLAESLGIGNGNYYANIESKKLVHQKEFTSDLFYIESSTNNHIWKLNNNTKKIGNYNCYEATTITSLETVRGSKEIPVTAWYTTDIPLPFGPANFTNLPGLILELHLNNVIVYADAINLNKKGDIKVPKKGIKITEQEFVKLQKDGFSKYKN